MKRKTGETHDDLNYEVFRIRLTMVRILFLTLQTNSHWFL